MADIRAGKSNLLFIAASRCQSQVAFTTFAADGAARTLCLAPENGTHKTMRSSFGLDWKFSKLIVAMLFIDSSIFFIIIEDLEKSIPTLLGFKLLFNPLSIH